MNILRLLNRLVYMENERITKLARCAKQFFSLELSS